jgi:thiopurine S-methyltransferase
MEASFWHKKWERGEIGFHTGVPNPLLTSHLDKLNLTEGSRIFLPLCGKTRDIAWLLACDYQIVGAELSEIAISALFAELGVTPTITQAGGLTRYSAENLDIFVGDIFHVTADHLGAVHAIYDRAALVALPESMRTQYASHLVAITAAAPQLLITYEYDQQLLDGPPFSINADEVARLYHNAYQCNLVERTDVVGGFRGCVPSTESVWLLR